MIAWPGANVSIRGEINNFRSKEQVLFRQVNGKLYPGYQRLILACDGELRFVGRRPTCVRLKAEDTSGKAVKT